MKKPFATVVLFIGALLTSSLAFAQTSGTGTGTGTASAGASGGQVVYAPNETSTSTVKYAASSAIPAGLVAGLATCMGSSSSALSAHVVSISIGSTWKDEDCQAANFSQLLYAHGQPKAAIGVMCSRPVIRYAIATTGGIAYARKDGVVVYRPCPMSEADWHKAGEPLLDPISGQPYSAAELDPPVKVVAPVNTVGALTDQQQEALLKNLSPEQKAQLSTMAHIQSVETEAQNIRAGTATQ
ncbi:hypothetical protein [Paraburkholderia sp. BCC1886]|uniref:hypothetical protein n=1 Tax=Paraburkholderia sp. BCC1886 TaxID=2562670 RepID=UPI001182D5FF|nr:hypothetical protein [Paraburkholderia sp. BCC1886]